MSSVRSFKGGKIIGTTFNLWYKSSLKFPLFTSSLIFLLEVLIILTFTLISLDPLTLLNFWSVKTLKIFAWVSNGISVTSSINKEPSFAFSKKP